MKVKYEDFEKYRKSLYKHALNATKIHKVIDDSFTGFYQYDVALDVVQETYLRWHMYITKQNFQMKHDIEGFLHSIVKYECLKTFGNRRKYNSKEKLYECFQNNELENVDIMELFPEFSSNNVQSYVEVHDIYKLMELITPVKQKIVVMLSYQGYSIYEIAKQLGNTTDYVKQLSSQGKKKLKELLINN